MVKLILSGFQSSLVVIVTVDASIVRAAPAHSTLESVRTPQATEALESSHLQREAAKEVGSHCNECNLVLGVVDVTHVRAVF